MNLPSTFTYNGMLKTNEIAGEGNSFHTAFRGYDPRLGRFFSKDKMSFSFPTISPYSFSDDNPIFGKDDSGLYTIFVNGYIHGGPDIKNEDTETVLYEDDISPGRPYWSGRGDEFIEGAHDYFGDDKANKFINGSGDWIGSTASSRQSYGRQIGKLKAEQIMKEIIALNTDGDKTNDVHEINIVTHSMGAAVAEGMLEEFMKNKDMRKLLKKGEVVHMSAADGDDIVISKNSRGLKRSQLNYTGDFTLFYKDNGSPYNGGYLIPGVKRFGLVSANMSKLHPEIKSQDLIDDWDFHYDSKTFNQAWQFLKVLNQKFKSKTDKNDGKPIKLTYKDLPSKEEDGETKQNLK